MADDLARELEEARSRDEVRVVVIGGAAGAFSAGADISGANAHENFDVTALDRANRIIRAVTSLDKPVLGAVNGIAAGVGCSIAVACDLVVAGESAGFLLAFARIGLMPDGGATAIVAASIGRARAMRMALLAEPLTAHEAYDAGLVTHVASDGEVAEAGPDAGAQVGRRPTAGVRGDQEGDQRSHPDRAGSRPPTRAHRPDPAAADRRRRRRHACLRRASSSGLPRGVRLRPP